MAGDGHRLAAAGIFAGPGAEEHCADEGGSCGCHKLAPVYGRLNGILKHLNSESFDPSEAELDRLQAQIETLADKLEKLME